MSDIVPKKYPNAGLRKDAGSKKVQESIDPFQNGGLNDEDADAVRPSFPQTSTPQSHAPITPRFIHVQPGDFKRNPSRMNNVRRTLVILCIPGQFSTGNMI
jgi:hypothetical protein